MASAPSVDYRDEMKRVAELERLARVAREQARLTTNRETSEVLLQIAAQYQRVADDRRAVLEGSEHGAQSL